MATRPVSQPVRSNSEPPAASKINRETCRIDCILEKIDGTLSTVTNCNAIAVFAGQSLCNLFERGAFDTARSFNRTALIPQEDLFEAPRDVSVKRIWTVGIFGPVTPMFIHP